MPPKWSVFGHALETRPVPSPGDKPGPFLMPRAATETGRPCDLPDGPLLDEPEPERRHSGLRGVLVRTARSLIRAPNARGRFTGPVSTMVSSRTRRGPGANGTRRAGSCDRGYCEPAPEPLRGISVRSLQASENFCRAILPRFPGDGEPIGELGRRVRADVADARGQTKPTAANPATACLPSAASACNRFV